MGRFGTEAGNGITAKRPAGTSGNGADEENYRPLIFLSGEVGG